MVIVLYLFAFDDDFYGKMFSKVDLSSLFVFFYRFTEHYAP